MSVIDEHVKHRREIRAVDIHDCSSMPHRDVARLQPQYYCRRVRVWRVSVLGEKVEHRREMRVSTYIIALQCITKMVRPFNPNIVPFKPERGECL